MYEIISKNLTTEDNINYIGYGVADFENKIIINDISTDYSKIKNWIDLLNKHQLSPLHIGDAVQDFLSQL